MTQMQNVNYIARSRYYHLAYNWRMRRVIDRNGAVAWVPTRDFSTHYDLSSFENYVEATFMVVNSCMEVESNRVRQVSPIKLLQRIWQAFLTDVTIVLTSAHKRCNVTPVLASVSLFQEGCPFQYAEQSRYLSSIVKVNRNRLSLLRVGVKEKPSNSITCKYMHTRFLLTIRDL